MVCIPRRLLKPDFTCIPAIYFSITSGLLAVYFHITFTMFLMVGSDREFNLYNTACNKALPAPFHFYPLAGGQGSKYGWVLPLLGVRLSASFNLSKIALPTFDNNTKIGINYYFTLIW